MKNFKEFLNEGRGISDRIKEYSDYIYRGLIRQGEICNTMFDFKYSDFSLCDLRVEVELSNFYHGSFNPSHSYFNKNELYDVVISIDIDKNNYDDIKIMGIVVHELTHVKEYYDIMTRMLKNNIDIKPTHVRIKEVHKLLNDVNNGFETFVDLLYLSLDSEMNARIAQVYPFLYNLNSKDVDYMYSKLEQHENFIYLNMLNSFNSVKFVDDNIKELELGGLLKNLNELYDFYYQWSLYFKSKTDKHISKYKYLMKEVIEDLNGKRPYNENYRMECLIRDKKIKNSGKNL